MIIDVPVALKQKRLVVRERHELECGHVHEHMIEYMGLGRGKARLKPAIELATILYQCVEARPVDAGQVRERVPEPGEDAA